MSVTTRPARLEEKNGKDYEFVSRLKFQGLKRRGEFLESARIFDYDYGTRRKPIEEEIRKGRTVILAIDIQGARDIRRRLRGKIPFFSIFILPPSIPVLRERLEGRSTDSAEEIEKRIQRAEEEIKAAREYDRTIVNHDLDQTTHEIEGLISEFEKQLEGGK